jgi:crotonobetainyl-CoA:carnitine CoA-transferase CaiB-like acyl-CoA transferase
VLDLATIVAAPFAATLLADYGADVLKVELPGSGDGARGFPPFKEGKSLWWKVTNRNKRLVTLDLRKPEGAALLKQLLPRFDVLIENFRPGTLDAWGLDRETLWSIQPNLVILRVTGFGQTGPYKSKPGFARIFEAMSGLTYISGDPDGEPMHAGYPLGDAVGGLFGALGILAALWQRAQAPRPGGEEIDLSLTEASLRLLEFLPIEYEQLGVVRERSGNANQYSAPAAVYRTKDGRWVSLAGSTNALFARNCRAIDRCDLIDDPRFADNEARVRHMRELNDIFRAWCASHDQPDVLQAFERAGGTIAPIYSAADVCADPHFEARQAIVSVPDQDFGTVRMPNVVPCFLRTPGHVSTSAGAMAQDNEEVYGEWLGMSPAEMQRLRELQVI